MALNEFMSRQVTRKQQPEFNPGLVPGDAIPCLLLPPPPPHTYFNYTHVVAITFHFVLLSLHTLSLLQLRPLFTCSTACCCCRWCSRLRTTPGQPREFYAHTMKRFSHLSFHRPGPFRPSVSPPGRVTMAPKRQRISRQNVWFNWLRAWFGCGVH